MRVFFRGRKMLKSVLSQKKMSAKAANLLPPSYPALITSKKAKGFLGGCSHSDQTLEKPLYVKIRQFLRPNFHKYWHLFTKLVRVKWFQNQDMDAYFWEVFTVRKSFEVPKSI